MSDTKALSNLANFVAKSPLASENQFERKTALNSIVKNLTPAQPIHKKVTNLMDTVLVLSARTRRLGQPKVNIDLDVFTPDNHRAVRIMLDN
jgi:hypothetical protein